MVLGIYVYTNRDVRIIDNDNAAAVRTCEVGVTVVKAFGEIRSFLLLGESNFCFLV